MKNKTQKYTDYFFHFGQIIWKQIQNHELSVGYIDNVEFVLQVQKLGSTCFYASDGSY